MLHSLGMEVFSTTRFVVRQWQGDEQDARACFAIYSNEAVSRWLERPPYRALDQARAANLRQLERYTRLVGMGWWPITTRVDGEVIGQAALMPMDDEPGEVELGYHVRHDWWGRGVATEVARGAIAHARANLAGYRVVAVTRPHNTGSRRVMEKAGLLYEGATVFKGLESVKYGLP
ncbi:MAG: GNAT family N-acetyltransferase [Deltaproteobacteria bacterium]|nr:GNAT family N-acetyltransferase [Deltaproteobacteria bacterium]